jgi:hypothetical protein
VKLFVAVLLFATSALAADFNGRWKGNALTEGQASPIFLSLLQQGNTLTGTGGPTANDPDILQNGKVEGKRIVFDLIPGGRFPLHFDLTLDGAELKGTVKVQRNGQTVTGQVFLKKRTT